jgi:two-component system, cell cycle response regulator DivK
MGQGILAEKRVTARRVTARVASVKCVRQGNSGASVKKKILIVEDNDLNMKLFCDLLEAHDYDTVQARDGSSVMGIARAELPDLILMDIQLPEVSGLEVTKWLKQDELLKHIPVIAVTAFAMKGDEERIREGGCEAYIAKPISVLRFIETIRQFV